MEHYHYKIPGWFSFPKLYTSMVNIHEGGAHFVEVGSWMGASAAYMGVEIANSGKNIRFDCIDEWSDYVAEGLHMKELPKAPGDFVYNLFKENTEPVKKYVHPLRKTSGEASLLFRDETLDFVFIDANHVYEAVLDDLRMWFPKVKKNGFIAGHDFKDEPVKKAVEQFFGKDNFISDWSENCWAHYKQ